MSVALPGLILVSMAEMTASDVTGENKLGKLDNLTLSSASALPYEERFQGYKSRNTTFSLLHSSNCFATVGSVRAREPIGRTKATTTATERRRFKKKDSTWPKESLE